jgi:hypothetical protein
MAIVSFMILALGLTGGITVMVVVGMQGRGRARAPQLSDRLARTAQHLNGDAEPPVRFLRVLREWGSRLLRGSR